MKAKQNSSETRIIRKAFTKAKQNSTFYREKKVLESEFSELSEGIKSKLLDNR